MSKASIKDLITKKKFHRATIDKRKNPAEDTKRKFTSIYLVLDEGVIYQTVQTVLIPHSILTKARTILPHARFSSPRRNALSWND